MEDKENQTPNPQPSGDAGSSGQIPTPKVEVRDGAIFIDGKKTVYESDLLAAKHSLESKLETAQSVHEQAIDNAKLELSKALQQVAELNAKTTEAQQARESGATVDVARIEQELAAAKSSVETLKADAASALEYRKEMMIVKYSIPADSLKDKTMTQLDSFEEALKALATSRGSGPGPYAVGGGGGTATPMTPMDRARQILDNTPIRGVRSAEVAK